MRSKIPFSVAALALASTAACNSCGPDGAARGSASITWSITALGGIATCARAGATSVSLALHSRGSADEARFEFPCTDSQATTPPITAGPYEATLTLRASDGATLAVGPTQAAVAIGAGQVTTLAPVVFAVEGGRLLVSLSTVATSANCTSREQGGAGTTGNTISLVNAGGGCAAVPFTRLRGTTRIGEYMVNCSSPQIATCIERDETLVADGLRPGPYVITVGALIGAARCSSEVDVLSVPAGATAVKPLQLAPNGGPGC
jgi:hypothetical protein